MSQSRPAGTTLSRDCTYGQIFLALLQTCELTLTFLLVDWVGLAHWRLIFWLENQQRQQGLGEIKNEHVIVLFQSWKDDDWKMAQVLQATTPAVYRIRQSLLFIFILACVGRCNFSLNFFPLSFNLFRLMSTLFDPFHPAVVTANVWISWGNSTSLPRRAWMSLNTDIWSFFFDMIMSQVMLNWKFCNLYFYKWKM